MAEFARATRLATGHAPIGEFRRRFELGGPSLCACGGGVESRRHMMSVCPIWNRTPHLNGINDGTHGENITPAAFLDFLKRNPMAATFEWDAHVREVLEDQMAMRRARRITTAPEGVLRGGVG